MNMRTDKATTTSTTASTSGMATPRATATVLLDPDDDGSLESKRRVSEKSGSYQKEVSFPK